MRFIFISLLATNFVLAMWVYFSADKAAPEPDSTPGAAGLSALSAARAVVPGVDGLAAQNAVVPGGESSRAERPAAGMPPSGASAAANQAGRPPTLGGRELCTVIGPFNNLAQADILVEQLAALAVRAELRKVEVPINKNFWLYLDPMASKEEAKAKLSELHAQGVDSYIIPKGDYVNGISIGFFVEQYRADIRKKQLADLGHDVSVRVDVRTAEQSWVVAKAKETVVVSSATWANLLEGGDEVTYKQNYCSDVASLQ